MYTSYKTMSVRSSSIPVLVGFWTFLNSLSKGETQRPWGTWQKQHHSTLHKGACRSQPNQRFLGTQDPFCRAESWVLVPACLGLQQEMWEPRSPYFQGLPGSPHNPWIHNLPAGLAGNQVSFYWGMSKQKTFDKLTFLKGGEKKALSKNSWPALTGRMHPVLFDT